MISSKDSHFLDHSSPQEDDELPPLESVELEPALGGGTFLMGINMGMVWKCYGKLTICWIFLFGISFGMFFLDLFGIWKTNPSTDIYFPACVWSIFLGNPTRSLLNHVVHACVLFRIFH